MRKIADFEPENPFFLAPMEAVNCASFRLLCKRRGAGLVYTDMIDADIFKEFAEESVSAAVEKFVNPQNDEKPLAVQIGGADVNNLLFVYEAVKEHAALIDYNIGCPLGYMLGKKGGCYLMKHPDQLYKIVEQLRKKIKLPFTVKMRSGWDNESINAVEICQQLEKLGVDAVAIHPRTRKQRYMDKADWQLVRKIKESVGIPVILSGDVTNAYMAHRAFEHTKCDFIMIGRGAKNNPSVFKQLNDYWQEKKEPSKPNSTYNKNIDDAKKDFLEFLELYKTREKRNKFSEIKDHAIWSAAETELKQKIIDAISEEELVKLFSEEPVS